MRRRRWLQSRSGRSALSLAALLVVAVGFCVFDADHLTRDDNGPHDHTGSSDLCGAFMPPSRMARPVVALFLIGSSLVHPAAFAPDASPALPDPPPKA
jgi:hypothetical protein